MKLFIRNVAIIVMTALFAFTAAPAFAFSVSSEAERNPPRTTTPGNPNPTNPGGSSGGWVSNWKTRTVNYVSEFYNYGCAPTDKQGQKLISYRATYRMPAAFNWSAYWGGLRRGQIPDSVEHQVSLVSKSCIYPPSYKDHDQTVVLESSAQIERTVPKSKVLKSKTVKSAWGKGSRTIAALNSSRSTSASVTVPEKSMSYGRYYGKAQSVVQTVTVRKWASNRAKYPDKIVGTGPKRVVNQASAKGELSCDGYRDGWSKGKKQWNLNDCLDNPKQPKVLRCSTSKVESIGDVKGDTATFFRDGVPSKIKWSAVSKPVGKRVVSVNKGSTKFSRSGSPFGTVKKPMFELGLTRTGKSVFKKSPGDVSRKIAGEKSEAHARAYWASNQGDPTLITPSWSFSTVKVKVPSVSITYSSGTFKTKATTSIITSAATCKGDTASLDYLRSVASKL